MEKNLFEELRERKQRVLILATKAKDYGWITPEREAEIKDKIEKDVLTIGVIGQMKCGKSTVLNSIVFEDDVLPSATTPMTAALSVITYGEEKKIEAEFYTSDEWAEQKMQAARPLSEVEGNTLEESKVKAAKELVEKSHRLGSTINSFLGKIKDDTLDQLEEYVGADGKYVSITKSVKIYYPKDYLKGVEIVDTPGFNDPIVSREERTKRFLNKADVVLLMLYAGRPFDATDRDILFKNVRECGIGKVLVGINKYDIPYHNGETEEVIRDYVKDEIRKACRDCDDSTLVEILQDTEPIPLSAEMALLSELPMSKINASEIYREAWKRHCDDFEISSQPQMMEKSHLASLMAAIKQVIEKEKVEILLRKPLSAIINAGSTKKAKIDKDIADCSFLVKTLSQPDSEIEERQNNLLRADRRLSKKIDALGDDIEAELRNIIRRGKNTLEDDIDEACKKMDNIISDKGSKKTKVSKLRNVHQSLVERTLKRHTQDIGKQATSVIKKCVATFIDEASDVMFRYISDFDSQSFLKNLKNAVDFNIDNTETFKGEADWLEGVKKKNLGNSVMELKSTDVSVFVDSIMGNKDHIISLVKEKVIDELLKPLEKQLDVIIADKDGKQQRLAEAKENLGKLEADKAVIEKQLAEFE